MAIHSKSPVLPGFGLSLGITSTLVFTLIVLPLAALVVSAAGLGWDGFLAAIGTGPALASYRLTILSSAGASLVTAILGLITAWTLTRYRFPGQRFFDALVDLPFAVPGSVGGIALAAAVSANGFLGKFLVPAGIQLAYTSAAVPFALIFSGLPLVIRSVQPVLEALDPGEEEAAMMLGAGPLVRFFRVLLPPILPALGSGMLLAFIRGLGEFGTVVFISGNIPFVSEVTTQVIYNRVDQYDRAGAAAVSMVLMAVTAVALVLPGLIRAVYRIVRRIVVRQSAISKIVSKGVQHG